MYRVHHKVNQAPHLIPSFQKLLSKAFFYFFLPFRHSKQNAGKISNGIIIFWTNQSGNHSCSPSSFVKCAPSPPPPPPSPFYFPSYFSLRRKITASVVRSEERVLRLGDLIKAKEEALAPLSRTNTARERSTNEGRDDTQRERERERRERSLFACRA